MSLPQETQSFDDRLTEVISMHFDPKWGTPYWVERARYFTFDPRDEIRSISDLERMGLMKPTDLQKQTIEYYIPRQVLSEKRRLVTCQTGGTSGSPTWTAYLDEEFDEAFVDPFVAAARHVNFPQELQWLYVGPSGPHVIGRAAEAIARCTGSAAPFSVDFDSRWAKKLPTGSFAADRYLTHVVDQAMAILSQQSIGVLFTTPPVLRCLAERMTRVQCERIRGVHYGGLAMDTEELARFQLEVFPNAVHLCGYGNSLFGCCLELTVEPWRDLTYFPHGNRLVFGVLPDHENEQQNQKPIYHIAGSHGRVVFSRIDRTMLLINVVERDEGTLVQPAEDVPTGFMGYGIASPQPIRSTKVPSGVALY